MGFVPCKPPISFPISFSVVISDNYHLDSLPLSLSHFRVKFLKTKVIPKQNFLHPDDFELTHYSLFFCSAKECIDLKTRALHVQISGLLQKVFLGMVSLGSICIHTCCVNHINSRCCWMLHSGGLATFFFLNKKSIF